MRHIRHLFALGAMILATAAPVAAQFTTVVAPPKKPVDAAVADARAAQAAASDTGRRATLQEMSAWVDSVAGTAPSVAAAPQVVDSAGGDVVATAEPAPSTERFSDGARAPNTASPLPALLLAGVLAMLTGVAMLASRRREA